MHSVDHAGFLAVAIATHALVGYTLGVVAFDAPRAGLVAGLLPDVDLLVPAAWGAPFVHRGVTHGALAAGVAVGVAALWGRWSGGDARARRIAGAAAAGYGAHLLLDATTPMGVPLAAPVSMTTVGVTLHGHSAPATALLWSACLVALWWDDHLGRDAVDAV